MYNVYLYICIFVYFVYLYICMLYVFVVSRNPCRPFMHMGGGWGVYWAYWASIGPTGRLLDLLPILLDLLG